MDGCCKFTQDDMKGLGIPWQISFNFSTLRMLSFSMDYYWAVAARSNQFESHCLTCTSCSGLHERLCEKGRELKSPDLQKYNAINYLIYLFYPPLYLAGPIISFNNFLFQVCSNIYTVPKEAFTTFESIKSDLWTALASNCSANGSNPSSILCGCNQRHEKLGRIFIFRGIYPGILQFEYYLAQGNARVECSC